jgi:hypothetical protein
LRFSGWVRPPNLFELGPSCEPIENICHPTATSSTKLVAQWNFFMASHIHNGLHFPESNTFVPAMWSKMIFGIYKPEEINNKITPHDILRNA